MAHALGWKRLQERLEILSRETRGENLLRTNAADSIVIRYEIIFSINGHLSLSLPRSNFIYFIRLYHGYNTRFALRLTATKFRYR